MISDVTQLKEALVSSGWVEHVGDPLKDIDAVLFRSYAVVGILVVPDARAAMELWLAAQTELGELRSTLGQDRDLYLLICLQEIEPDAMDDLPTMINDTHTCRKMVLELRGRSGEEALSDVPILFWREQTDNKAQSEILPPINVPISDHVLEDLGNRAPGRILDALLDGAYESDVKL